MTSSSMRGIRIAFTLLALVAAPTVALAAGGSSRVLAPGCATTQYKPKKLILGCDGSNYLKSLTWTSWTRKRATGSGIDEVDDCMPDCASGHFHAYPASVTLSRPGRCPHLKHRVFRHIDLTYGTEHPPGRPTDSGPLACPV
jgi:hypothetical protein